MSAENAMTTDIDAIRERLALVSGYGTDWSYEDDDENRTWVVGYATTNPQAGLIATVPDYGEQIADLIANAPRDLAALLAVIDHLKEKHAEALALAMRRGEEISRLHGELRAATS